MKLVKNTTNLILGETLQKTRQVPRMSTRDSIVREDFLQKTTTLLAKTYQHILVEDLNVFRLDG